MVRVPWRSCACAVFISILVFALPTGALASGFEGVSATYVAQKKRKKRGELANIAVEDSDEELLKDAEEVDGKERTTPLGASVNAEAGMCPTCGK
jgi:hypothetical protein